MANPQLEDGFLGIAHSINEAIMLRDFTKRQRKILDLILRLSWGCHKKYAYIPHQRDFTVVGLYEPDVANELNWLAESKVILRDGGFYGFNKDFDQWQVSRVKPYQPEKLSELLSLNLNGNCPQLSKTLSENLVFHEVPTSCFTKFLTPELASPKESIKENIKKGYIDKEISGGRVGGYNDLTPHPTEKLERMLLEDKLPTINRKRIEEELARRQLGAAVRP